MKSKILKILKSKIFITFLCIVAVYTIWHVYNAHQDFHTPKYKYFEVKKTDSADTVFKGTGLSPWASRELIESGDFEIVKKLNTLFFKKPQYKKNYIAYPVTAEERNETQYTPLAPLKDGDILVTFNTHTLSWRHGHLALVTDAKNGTILEHMAIGQTSCYGTANKWGNYPAFAVLRYPDEKIAKAAAEYAQNNLLDIPYNILAGVFKKDKSQMENIDSSHCSHIVWQAYKAVGADIDRDGGFLVTPKDVALCKDLKVVQIFGLDPNDYKDRILK